MSPFGADMGNGGRFDELTGAKLRLDGREGWFRTPLVPPFHNSIPYIFWGGMGSNANYKDDLQSLYFGRFGGVRDVAYGI